MDASQKEYIVKLHNRMRNRIAMGEIKKYSPAAKMPCFVSEQFVWENFNCEIIQNLMC